ncbi:MAG: serine/threonine-protein phosphatase [Lachnospiraceae bacterium]|nr:serine/threonine-protein phosphatase [Lachnospiraceae bacterium]
MSLPNSNYSNAELNQALSSNSSENGDAAVDSSISDNFSTKYDEEVTVEAAEDGSVEFGTGFGTEPFEERTHVESRELGIREKKEERSDSGLLVTVCVIIGALLIAIIAFVVVWRKKRRKESDLYEMTRYDPTKYEPIINSSIENDAVAGGTAKILSDGKETPFRIGCIHGVGKRAMQQDSFGISEVKDASAMKKGIMAVVADGMGGLSDGERMSQMVVVKMLQGFDSLSDDFIPSSALLGLVGEANEAVNQELGESRIGKCGSTVVAVILKDRKLSWISVGDSHIYVWRKNQLVQLNTDHNYGTELDREAERGEISFEKAATDPQRAALTSYIGIGDLELIDQNETPIMMERGDRILLMSDGIYGTVDERAISEMMTLPFSKALSAIERAVSDMDKRNQDNYTCVVIEVKDAFSYGEG